jgi:CheY-like chemotaxis protein/HPt (histidine-containing phosphotransfer) domain-containing protein
MSPKPKPVRILVVDDDTMSRELIGLILQRAGYIVESAATGESALDQIHHAQICQAAAPDLILADLQMPGLSGAHLAAELRRTCPPSTLLLAMSATRPPEESIAGFNRFILKPFNVAEITAVLPAHNPPPAHDTVLAKSDLADDKAAPVLDQKIYQRIAASMPTSKVREMYALCVSDARKRIVLMRQLVVEGDAALFVREAHAIKGSGGMLGALELRTTAARLELRGLAPAVTTEDIVYSLDELSDACDRLERILVSRARGERSCPRSRSRALEP